MLEQEKRETIDVNELKTNSRKTGKNNFNFNFKFTSVVTNVSLKSDVLRRKQFFFWKSILRKHFANNLLKFIRGKTQNVC